MDKESRTSEPQSAHDVTNQFNDGFTSSRKWIERFILLQAEALWLPSN